MCVWGGETFDLFVYITEIFPLADGPGEGGGGGYIAAPFVLH